MTWSETTLGACACVEHGFAFKGEHFSDSGQYVVLTPGNFHEEGGFRPRPGKDRFYVAPFPERYLLQEGALIVAMTEQGEGLLGSAALIPNSGTYLHNQRLGLVKEKSDVADRRFLYYVFNTESVREQIRNTSSGAKVRHTSPERIYSARVRIPEVAAQRKIAAILSAYDDLIANNQRRIALLETMAEEICREWFVRMRFPGAKAAAVEKGVLKGWGVEAVSDLVAEQKRSIKRADLAAVERYVGLEHISRKSIALVDWSSPAGIDSDKLLFAAGDILFGKIRPYLHKVALAHFGGACSTDTIVLRPRRPEVRAFALFTVFSQTFIDLATTASKGTKMPRADWHFLKRLEIRTPGRPLLLKFQAIVEPMLDDIKLLVSVNQELKCQRDALLPRLISGRLKVDHLDIRWPRSMQDKVTA